MSQLRNMIVLAARQRESPFCRQIVPSMHRNIFMKSSQGAKDNEYSYQPENVKKKTYALYISSINCFFLSFYIVKGWRTSGTEPGFNSLFPLSSCFPSPTSLSEINSWRGEGWWKFQHLGNLLLWSMSFLSPFSPFYGTQICKWSLTHQDVDTGN